MDNPSKVNDRLSHSTERERDAFWGGFAIGFLYLLFLVLLEIFIGPYLDEAEAGGMPLIITGLAVWIGSKTRK